MPEGIISKIFGAYYNLRPLPDCSAELRGRLRGKLRLEKRQPEHSRYRHLIMVGDRVEFDAPTSPGADVRITDLHERRNAVHRGTSTEIQSLGANLDRAFGVMSLASPRPRWGFLDRFLVSCNAGGVAAEVVLTKPDLVAAEEQESVRRMIELYRGLGYPVYVLNGPAGEPLEEVARIRAAAASGVSLLAGQSGTGKSTLLNLLMEASLQETGDISRQTGKGRHTTTNSSMFRHPASGALWIDTPGVREWGVQHLERRELFAAFPEIAPHTDECEYRDCQHEPDQDGCAVQACIEESRQRALDYYARLEAEEEEAAGRGDAADEEDFASDVPPFEPGYLHPERYRSLRNMLAGLGQFQDRIRGGDYKKATGRVRSGKLRPN